MFVQSERSVNSSGFTLSFGLVSLSVHPYFVRQNTERAAKVHFFLAFIIIFSRKSSAILRFYVEMFKPKEITSDAF